MPFAAALSEHPVPALATGEVIGEVLDRVGEAPDLAVLFVSAAHTGAVEDVVTAVRSLLGPRTLLGCTASTVAGPSREVEDAPAVSLWAARSCAAAGFRLEHQRSEDGSGVVGFPASADLPADPRAVLVLADPFTFPTDAFLTGLREQTGVELPVVGGLASAARGPGGNRLVLDGSVASSGAVGAVLAEVDVHTVVSQGCRPIGDPMVVTRGGGQVIAELAGRPALERVQQILEGLGPDDLALARAGLHLGRVVDEHKLVYGQGDFLIRNVLGAERGPEGGLVVGDDVEVGATVQLQVRDAASADADLRSLLAPCDADGALLFTCNGRGTHLFGEPDHDAAAVADILADPPLAGMSCAGEVGPVGTRSFLHGFTASMLLFRES